MNDPILQSGFPQSPPPPSADVSKDVSAFTFAVAEKVAGAASQKQLSSDVMLAAAQGVTPLQFFDSLGKKAQEVATVNSKMDNDIADLRTQIAGLKPQEADNAGYRAAMDAFNGLASQAPVAPTLQKLNLTDTDKMMLGFALLTGANPQDAIGNFIKVKQGFVDQNNDLAMGQYKLDMNQFGQQLDAAGNIVQAEGQQLNREQSRLNQEYETQYRGLASQLEDAYSRADDQQKQVIQTIGRVSDDFRQTFTAQGTWSQEDEDDAQAFLTQQAGILGIDPDSLIASVPRPRVGSTTANAQNQQADNKLADHQFEFNGKK